jgi:hypothetical protein
MVSAPGEPFVRVSLHQDDARAGLQTWNDVRGTKAFGVPQRALQHQPLPLKCICSGAKANRVPAISGISRGKIQEKFMKVPARNYTCKHLLHREGGEFT